MPNQHLFILYTLTAIIFSCPALADDIYLTDSPPPDQQVNANAQQSVPSVALRPAIAPSVDERVYGDTPVRGHEDSSDSATTNSIPDPKKLPR